MREGERQTDSQTDRQRLRERQRETKRERGRERAQHCGALLHHQRRRPPAAHLLQPGHRVGRRRAVCRAPVLPPVDIFRRRLAGADAVLVAGGAVAGARGGHCPPDPLLRSTSPSPPVPPTQHTQTQKQTHTHTQTHRHTQAQTHTGR